MSRRMYFVTLQTASKLEMTDGFAWFQRKNPSGTATPKREAIWNGVFAGRGACPLEDGAAAVFLRLMDIRYYELRSSDIKDYRTTGQTRDQAG